jgi:hypothetical protein
MMSCVLTERSKNKESNATIHAPIAKKNKIRPGIANSSKKNINPAMNHITAALRKLSIKNVLRLHDNKLKYKVIGLYANRCAHEMNSES